MHAHLHCRVRSCGGKDLPPSRSRREIAIEARHSKLCNRGVSVYFNSDFTLSIRSEWRLCVAAPAKLMSSVSGVIAKVCDTWTPKRTTTKPYINTGSRVQRGRDRESACQSRRLSIAVKGEPKQ